MKYKACRIFLILGYAKNKMSMNSKKMGNFALFFA